MKVNEEKRIIIIGAGAAGLSAALSLAENGFGSLLISDMPSERAQSVMAEGGINAATDEKTDSPKLHAEETIKAGRFLADSEAVKEMTEAAPALIEKLFSLGMSFTLDPEKKPDVRGFGGQRVKRTHYASSDTGKQLMHTLTEQVRRYEADGIVERLTGWLFSSLIRTGDGVCGCELVHYMTQEKRNVYGKVIIASGGLGGMFGNATGSVRNTGAVSAALFKAGVRFSNLEFIQYHPTTVKLYGKNMLITEAVRGEGGRLYVLRDGKPWYFMEDKYPELGNLMPRDVISREEYELIRQGYSVFLDMSHLDKDIYKTKLSGVVEDCREFLGIDPVRDPVPVMPGIHYFMGGIWVDRDHRTSVKNLYAAGECACQYHGANRLGGNSLLGALYGGMKAAGSAMEDKDADITSEQQRSEPKIPEMKETPGSFVRNYAGMQEILKSGLGIVRDEDSLKGSIAEIDELIDQSKNCYDNTASEYENNSLEQQLILGKAMLLSALERKESRGAHTRSDYPEESDEFCRSSIVEYMDNGIHIRFLKAGENDGN